MVIGNVYTNPVQSAIGHIVVVWWVIGGKPISLMSLTLNKQVIPT